MSTNPLAGLIPRGSLGLKLLLVCLLVLAMGVPLLLVGGLVSDRTMRANQVTMEIGDRAGGPQVVGGPMLLVPYTREDLVTSEGITQRRTVRGNYVVFAETGSANADLNVEERRRGIYRAAIYSANVNFDATFDPADAVSGVSPDTHLDWAHTRIVMFVRDSRAIRDVAELRFPDGTTATLEPLSDLSLAAPPVEYAPGDPRQYSTSAIGPSNLQAFAAPAPLSGTPHEFTVNTRLVLTGAQRFSIAAFAQDTTATIKGNRRDVHVEGYFQSNEALQPSNEGFTIGWRVPFVARGMEKAADLANMNLGFTAGRDMGVSFVASNDIYQGVTRAVRYGIMFIGIVFLATLIFEAVSGKKAHPAQYVLVGLAQTVFYALLLAMTELIGFNAAFLIGAIATVSLLAFYASATFNSASIGIRAFAGLAGLYGAMYVLMTLEDLAMLAGSVVAFLVIAATMIATRRIDWYGRATKTS